MIVTGKKQATRNVYTATGAGTNESTAVPSTDFIAYIDEDAVLNSNLMQIQDGVFENYPRCDESKGDSTKTQNKQLEAVNFGRKIKSQFPAMWHNGNMFFEIDVIGNQLIGFYEIDPDTMKVNETDQGEVVNYVQTGVGNADKIFAKEKIMHIKAPSLRTGTLGKALLTPLTYPLARKKTAENYLAGIIQNLNPLLYMELEDSDDTQVKAIQDELRKKRDPLDPLKVISLLTGEKIGRVDTGTTSNFDAVQKYIDSQNDEIIRVVRIPPIVAGTVDNSNRSNSEIQERAVFGRTTNAWQNFFVKELNDQFKEKVGWKEPNFEFEVLDKLKQEAALVKANKLKELGYSQDAIHDVLIESGVQINKDFEELPEEQPADINGMPSREPRPKTGIPQNEEKRKQDIKNGTKKVSQ